MTTPENVTQVLQELRSGAPGAREELYRLVYDDLRRLAGSYMRMQPGHHTLQPTALVHESYLRLMGKGNTDWENRAHFVACAARAMRSVLVDMARAKGTLKRGGNRTRITFREETHGRQHAPQEVLAVHSALEKLASTFPDESRVVELRFFGGLSLDEVARVMNISKRSVCRRWEFARLWLYREVAG